jgi:hypothetical protein
MPLRFSRRFSIVPGLRVNVGTRGASLSVGHRGAWWTPANTTIPIWERMVDSRTVELTANDNTPYTWFWPDLRDGQSWQCDVRLISSIGPAARAIVTTRAQDIAAAISARMFDLPPLSTAEARTWMTRQGLSPDTSAQLAQKARQSAVGTRARRANT